MKFSNVEIVCIWFTLFIAPMALYTIGKVMPYDFSEKLLIGLQYIAAGLIFSVMITFVAVLIYAMRRYGVPEADNL